MKKNELGNNMQEVRVTPELAQFWLKTKNSRNRNINQRRVLELAIMINRGEWIATPALPITFDRDGQLIDGQHRLAAIVKSDKAVNAYIVKDEDPALRNIIDTGKPRSAGDVFALNGIQNATWAAAAIRTYFNLSAGGSSDPACVKRINGDVSYLPAALMDEYNKDSDFWNTVILAAAHQYKKGFIVPAIIGGCIAYFVRHDKATIEQAEEFFFKLRQGTAHGFKKANNDVYEAHEHLNKNANIGKIIFRTWERYGRPKTKTRRTQAAAANVLF